MGKFQAKGINPTPEDVSNAAGVIFGDRLDEGLLRYINYWSLNKMDSLPHPQSEYCGVEVRNGQIIRALKSDLTWATDFGEWKASQT